MTLDQLAARLGRRLKASRNILATAESCTGGWASQVVTSVAGSSEWFDRGFVTYSNAAKRELLGVKRATLDRYGAVSEQTAREMARGALARSRASVTLAITGVAGPGGGTPGKPVGMVCFAFAYKKVIRCETRRFRGGRAAVRRKSVVHALKGVLALLGARAGA